MFKLLFSLVKGELIKRATTFEWSAREKEIAAANGWSSEQIRQSQSINRELFAYWIERQVK